MLDLINGAKCDIGTVVYQFKRNIFWLPDINHERNNEINFMRIPERNAFLSGIKKEREYFLRNRSGTKWERECFFENRSGTKAEREREKPFHSEP